MYTNKQPNKQTEAEEALSELEEGDIGENTTYIHAYIHTYIHTYKQKWMRL